MITERELERKQYRIDAWEKSHMPTKITQTVRVMSPAAIRNRIGGTQ